MRTRHLTAAIVTTGLLLAACGSDDSSSSDTAAPAEASTPQETTADSAAPTEAPATEAPATEPPATEAPATEAPATDAPAADATVSVVNDPDLGEILVDSGGFTLYLFDQDEGTTTACTGECAANWPPLVAESPTAGEGVDQAELGTADGIEPNQVTYHGHLLYYFAGDQAPGDTNGVGIPSWFAVTPAGEAATAPVNIGY
jgi:predicted lipoprotein with Yx(FWY)xxD motif